MTHGGELVDISDAVLIQASVCGVNLVNLRVLVLLHRSVIVGFRVGGMMWDK